jgi:hypothetical protein
MGDVPDYQGVVSITGVPAVTISGTPTVNIGGTVTAQITAGTVDIQNVAGGVISSAGTLRYVGSKAGSGTLAVTLAATERSIIVVVPANALGATTVQVQTASGIQTKLSTFPVSAVATPGVCIAYANPGISTSWQVVIAADATQTCYVFADSDLATVAIASDETAPVYAQIVNNGPLSGGGAITPLYTQLVHGNTDLIGQQLAAGSVPVVLPSDQGRAWRTPYDSRGSAAPAGGVQAQVTLAATANRRWVVDMAAWTMFTTSAAALVNIGILDGSTQVFGATLAVPAVANSVDRFTLGPDAAIAGSLGNAVVVEFLAAGAATVFERLAYGAYLLPAGV